MGNYKVVFIEAAQKHVISHQKSGDRAVIKKLDKILNELVVNPYTGIGNPEPLKHELSGLWSRRLNQKHRLIYRIEENVVTVFIISAMGHYGDK